MVRNKCTKCRKEYEMDVRIRSFICKSCINRADTNVLKCLKHALEHYKRMEKNAKKAQETARKMIKKIEERNKNVQVAKA